MISHVEFRVVVEAAPSFVHKAAELSRDGRSCDRCLVLRDGPGSSINHVSCAVDGP